MRREMGNEYIVLVRKPEGKVNVGESDVNRKKI
jgi:hypothetical protein